MPGVAERLAYKSLDKSDVFFLFNKRNKDLVDLFLKNNLGGPALIFSRFAEKGAFFYLSLLTTYDSLFEIMKKDTYLTFTLYTIDDKYRLYI